MKMIETNKGKFAVVEIDSAQDGQYYVENLSSYHYNILEMNDEQASEIVEWTNGRFFGEKMFRDYKIKGLSIFDGRLTAKKSLEYLLQFHDVKITPNTCIFKL